MVQKKHFKKSIIAVIFFSLLSTTAFAYSDSSTRQEVYLGYGYPESAYTFVLYGLSGLFSVTASGGNSTLEVTDMGGYNGGYTWFPIDWLGVGGTVTGEFYQLNTKNTNTNQITDSEMMFASSIQGRIIFQYGKNLVRGYHGASVGINLISGENTSPAPIFAFNLTLAGIKIGVPRNGFSGYAELNIGTNTLISAGVVYSF